ncbi:MAG: pilus assembly PilX N-terminal domain-containing protein [Armatimonadetes bacterium]|nr:pilus assembly PilX N-terminal domain-containing protein [Armatimonadota bacterium]
MRIPSRRGAALVVTLLFMLLMVAWGTSLISLLLYGLRRSERDTLRAQALALADAGAERAIHYLLNTAPDGSTNASWRTTTPVAETIAGQGRFSLEVVDGSDANAGKVVVTSTGTAEAGDRAVSRAVRLVLTVRLLNISVWNNAIFGGVGQSGRSVNGNVAIRGNVHLLGDGEDFTDVDGDGSWDAGESYTDSNGNGVWDAGEPFTDSDGDGHYDAREPFEDVNGNGTRDPALTVTDLASEIAGDANMANSYQGMSSTVRALLPEIPTVSYNGETVQSLSATLRVKHGRVNISGSASVGYPDSPGGSPPVKEPMDGTYVSDGWGGNQGASHVYSDNGSRMAYDLGDVVDFPVVSRATTVDGVPYESHMEYLRQAGLSVTAPLTLTVGQTYGPVSDGRGNYLRVDTDGTITIQGIVYVNGAVNLNRNGNQATFRYTGSGTVVATDTIYVHTNLLPLSTFPTQDRLGMLARRRIELATGSGDAQLMLIGAFYAQEKIISAKQNEVAGSFVSSYYQMSNVPRIYHVPALPDYLPPGLPAREPIWVKILRIDGRREA